MSERQQVRITGPDELDEYIDLPESTHASCGISFGEGTAEQPMYEVVIRRIEPVDEASR